MPVWSRRMGFSFNALAIGTLFISNMAKIIFGTVKGKIRIYANEKVPPAPPAERSFKWFTCWRA